MVSRRFFFTFFCLFATLIAVAKGNDNSRKLLTSYRPQYSPPSSPVYRYPVAPPTPVYKPPVAPPTPVYKPPVAVPPPSPKPQAAYYYRRSPPPPPARHGRVYPPPPSKPWWCVTEASSFINCIFQNLLTKYLMASLRLCFKDFIYKFLKEM
ncbi:hypothetical protein YC2023_014470 [Brassica napus]